jgi:hypothetical protein
MVVGGVVVVVVMRFRLTMLLSKTQKWSVQGELLEDSQMLEERQVL